MSLNFTVNKKKKEINIGDAVHVRTNVNFFKKSASSKRNSSEKTQGKYQVSLNFTVNQKKKSGMASFMFLQVFKK